MILSWKRSRYEHPGKIISKENVHEFEHAEAEFGAFHLMASHNQRKFKDGTRDYSVYCWAPTAASKEWITLVRVRGHLVDAINAAEIKLFGNAVYGPEKYTIPRACVEVVEP